MKMSESQGIAALEKSFCVNLAKHGRAACKKCKKRCLAGKLRIAKVIQTPHGQSKNWHHLDCIFEQFLKQRVTTKRIETIDDLDGWDELSNEEKKEIESKILANEAIIASKLKNKSTPKKEVVLKPRRNSTSSSNTTRSSNSQKSNINKDLLFREFRRLIADITNAESVKRKIELVGEKFKSGSDGTGFKGSIKQWCRLLLPGDIRRIYKIQTPQIIKIFSKIFVIDQAPMKNHLKSFGNDVGETIRCFFEASEEFKPHIKSILTIEEVDEFLETLTKLSKEKDQLEHFKKIAKKCTANDLKIIIRLVKRDLRMSATTQCILDGIHPDAYSAYQECNDVNIVIVRCFEKPAVIQEMHLPLTPIKQALMENTKLIAEAIKKCPNGFYVDLKRGGKRVQFHRQNKNYKYFSELKVCGKQKFSQITNSIKQAFPQCDNLILDGEISTVKNDEGKNVNVCFYVHDCLHYNGESLIKQPLKYRKEILVQNMIEIPNRVMFTQKTLVNDLKQLCSLLNSQSTQDYEAIVFKDAESIYNTGKKQWIKIDKDKLEIKLNLIVLGAWKGTAVAANKKTCFLLCYYDRATKTYCDILKLGKEIDEEVFKELKKVKMTKKCPEWLKCQKLPIPDFFIGDPQQQPVWEITGTKLTLLDDIFSIADPQIIDYNKNINKVSTLDELKCIYQNLSAMEETNQKKLVPTHNNNKVKRKRSTGDPRNPPNKRLITNEEQVASEIESNTQFCNIFKNVKLLVETGGEEEFKDSLKEFTNFGGVLLTSSEWESATHVLHLNDTITRQVISCPKSTRHIIVEWINDSIDKRELLDFVPYTVRWEQNMDL